MIGTETISEEEIETLPHKFRITLAARCARRALWMIELLCEESDLERLETFVQLVEEAATGDADRRGLRTARNEVSAMASGRGLPQYHAGLLSIALAADCANTPRPYSVAHAVSACVRTSIEEREAVIQAMMKDLDFLKKRAPTTGGENACADPEALADLWYSSPPKLRPTSTAE